MTGRPPITSRGHAVLVPCALAAICGVILLQRLHTRDEPLERDVATYTVIAREMLRGRELYSDLWDHKPPAVYAVFAAAQVVAGDGPGSVLLLGLLCAWSTALALFAAGSWGSGAQTGLWAAAFWALLSGDLRLQADQPNTEALLNVGLAAGFAALLRVGPRRLDPCALLAGAFLALAVLLKPVMAPVAVALAAVHVAAPPPATPRSRAALQASLMLAMCGAAGGAVAAYFTATGRWVDLWATLVVHNRHYSGPLAPNLREGLRPARLFPPDLRDALPLALAALPGALLGGVRRWSRPAALLAAWLVTVPLVVAAPGKFFPHYYQLWLPPLCLAAAWSIAALARRSARPATATAAAGIAVTVALMAEVGPDYRLPAAAWSEAKYGDVFLRSRDVARDVEAMIAPGETFFHWGNEPELYIYTRRSPPTGVLWAQHMQYGPLRIALRTRALQQLSFSDPPLAVLSRDQPPPTGALGQWFKDRYEPHPRLRRRAGFSFWVRRGGALQRRLLTDSGR
jgi:4-amino-4-deoxy-L-arabinose transferase-like glycosyltransferase